MTAVNLGLSRIFECGAGPGQDRFGAQRSKSVRKASIEAARTLPNARLERVSASNS